MKIIVKRRDGDFMPFEKFTKSGRSYKPKASITSSGLIGFNNGSVKRFDLNNYKYCILYYDKEGRRIGIALTNDENEEGVCKLRNRASGADVSARAFFDFYKIDYSETCRYDATWDDLEEKIIVDIVDIKDRNQ